MTTFLCILCGFIFFRDRLPRPPWRPWRCYLDSLPRAVIISSLSAVPGSYLTGSSGEVGAADQAWFFFFISWLLAPTYRRASKPGEHDRRAKGAIFGHSRGRQGPDRGGGSLRPPREPVAPQDEALHLGVPPAHRSEEQTSELQSRLHLLCR